MKRLKNICTLLMIIVIMATNVFAGVGVYDTDISDSIYKFSDKADIVIPFIRFAGTRMVIDKDTFKSGISFAKDNIDIESNMSGIQVLMSSDTVRVTGDIEYGIILAPSVIIEGNVKNTLFVLAENLNITENAVISEDVIVSGNNVKVSGTIKGNILGYVSNITITGKILNDMRVNALSVNIDESEINGNIYIKSNNNIEVPSKYSNATIIKVQNTENNIISRINIWEIVRIALILTLIYILISSKTNVLKNMLSKAKRYPTFTVLMGSILIMLMPIIIFASLFLTIFGFDMIALPFAIAYFAVIIISMMLSTFLIGSILLEYTFNKFGDKYSNIWYKVITTFIMFAALGLIVYIPLVGSVISMVMCILSIGLVITMIFKKI